MTSTLGEARDHARRQSGAALVTIPATAAADLPDGVEPDSVTWDEIVPPGGYAGRRVTRDTVVRIADTEGDACVALLAWSSGNSAERLNVADTVKVQWQAYLQAGALLLSDMGRALLTIVEDSSARHDCLCGTTAEGRRLLVLGAMKHGLQRRDVPANVNLFKSVRVDDDGSLHFDGAAAPGTHVHLRTEQDVIVVVANVTHPLDDRPASGTPVRVTAWRAPRPADDPFREGTPERMRAFLNTEELVR